LASLGGEKGQESIGLDSRLTLRGGERTLSWSKASEPGYSPARTCFIGPCGRTEWCPWERSCTHAPEDAATARHVFSVACFRAGAADVVGLSSGVAGVIARDLPLGDVRGLRGSDGQGQKPERAAADPTAGEHRAPRGVAAG
jgi:hypothetical protein